MAFSAQVAYKFLRGTSRAGKLAATFAVGAMAKQAEARCRQMLSLDDHSQKDLDKLKNPYAAKYGPNGLGLHDPNEQVHTQSGALLDGLRADAPIATASGARAAVTNSDPMDTWIQLGTSKMIARPYMNYVRNTYAEEIIKAGADEAASRLTPAAVDANA
jgi:hypothetical protein